MTVPWNERPFECAFADGPEGEGIVLTLLIFILTVAIEIAAHYRPASSAKPVSPPPSSELEPNAGSLSNVSTSEQSDSEAQVTGTGSSTFVPSPSIRARRFTVSTTLFIILCGVFGVRVAGLGLGSCEQYVDVTAYWCAIIFTSFLPFLTACIAWLRTLVDCLLVRQGRSLRYPTKHHSGWPPFAPLSFIVVVIMAVTWGLMGSPDTSKTRGHDVELGEEERRLMNDIDGGSDNGADGPPAYDASWHPDTQREEDGPDAGKSTD